MHLVAGVRRLFDLDADPKTIDRHLSRDPRLKPLVRARRGLRVPGALDPFELGVRAILGQQVSVARATALSGALVAQFGRPVGGVAPFGSHARVPERVGDRARRPLDDRSHERPRARARTASPRRSRAGHLTLDRGAGLDETVARAVRGPGYRAVDRALRRDARVRRARRVPGVRPRAQEGARRRSRPRLPSPGDPGAPTPPCTSGPPTPPQPNTNRRELPRSLRPHTHARSRVGAGQKCETPSDATRSPSPSCVRSARRDVHDGARARSGHRPGGAAGMSGNTDWPRTTPAAAPTATTRRARRRCSPSTTRPRRSRSRACRSSGGS